jgi:hypothetical protein
LYSICFPCLLDFGRRVADWSINNTFIENGEI